MTKKAPAGPGGMSVEEVLALPAVMPLTVGGKVWGLGRNASYELAAAGEFPCKVLPLGKRLKVTKSAIMLALGIDAQGNPLTPAASDATEIVEVA